MDMNNKCVLPWIHTSSEPMGTCRSCCIARDSITDDDGTFYTIANSTFSEILNSNYMKNLRNEMRKGKYPSNCSICWEDESNNKQSKRLFYNDLILNQRGINVDLDNEPDQPLDLQLAMGNICNLKCRTCCSTYSSKWGVEAKDRGVLSSWNPNLGNINDFENSKFWTDIDNWSKNIRRLEIMGGEPFYMKEFSKLIDHLISNGTSQNIDLNLSTNGTIFDEDLLDKILYNFELLGFNISIDGINEHYDYIRHGNNWKNVKNNLDKFYQLYINQTKNVKKWNLTKQTKEFNHIKLNIGITLTISNLNFPYLREIHEFFENNYPNFKIWNNVVYFPEMYAANNIPDFAKQKYIDRVETPESIGKSPWNQEKYKNEILPIVNHAKQPYNDKTWYNFINETTAADGYRKESYKDTFPEMWELIKSEWKIRNE